MSDPDSRPQAENDEAGHHDRQSGEEVLEREEELQEDAERARDEEPGTDERIDEPESEEQEAEEDAEQVEGEWHVWIIAAVVVIGVALFFAPRFFLPELLGTLGAFLVAIGILGLAVKWAIGRSA